MPVGVPLVGTAARDSVSTTLGGTYSPLSHMTRVGNTASSSVTQTKFIQDATVSATAPSEFTHSYAGKFSVGDTGQGLVYAAKLAGTTLFLKHMRDGTNGWTQEVRVASITEGVDPDNLQDFTVEFASVGAQAIVGTGPVIG